MVDIPVNASTGFSEVAISVAGQTVCDFNFLVYSADSVRAIYTRSATGAETALSYPADFTVSGLGNPSGGAITLTSILDSAVGDGLVIYRDIEVKRLADYQPSGDFSAATVNRELDTAFMIMQEHERDLLRSVKASLGSGGAVLPDPDPGKGLAWDAGGALVNVLYEPGDVALEVAAAEAAAATAVAQVPLATAQVALATAQVGLAAAEKALAVVARTGAETAETNAEAALADTLAAAAGIGADADRAEAARDAALLSRGLFQTTAQGIGLGVRGLTITAGGSGGTNGTVTWTTTGGTAVIAARGWAIIAAGKLTAIGIDEPGHYSVAPTGLVLTGAGALAGATVAIATAVNTPVGGYFSVPVAGSSVAANLYRVDAGPVATFITDYASSQGLADVQAVTDAMFGSLDLWRWVEAAGAGLHIRRYRSLTTVNTSAYRFVLHAKAGTRKRIGLYSNVGVVFSASFDLELRTAVLHSGTAVLTVTYLANGTVECVVETTATSASTTNVQIYMLDASSLPGNARTGDGASTIYPHSLRAYKDGVELWPTNSGAFATAPWTGSSITMTEHAAQYLGVLGALAPPEASSLLLAGVKVDIIGNSLAAGLWPASFASLTGADVSVHATGGAALGVDGRGSPHYGSGVMMDHLENDTRADAEVILIDMCVNDIAASDVPLGTIADTTNATEAGAMAQANAWAKANRPNARLIFVVPTAAASTFATSDYRHGFANANGNFVEDFQVMTRRMANILGRPAIDPNAFGIGFADTENTSDGLHWDASGALKIAKIYAAEMTRLAEAGWLED